MHKLSTREITEADIALIADYWLLSEPEFLISMGVDLNKVPSRIELTEMLAQQLMQPYQEKQSYAIIWLIDLKPVGHCNINKIIFGKEAYIHLHLWNNTTRQKGAGTMFLKMTLPLFFENMQLKNLYCEPYALNEAPNKTLAKVGFDFEKEYITTPNSVNFEQPVKRWVMNHKSLQQEL